MKAVFTKFEKGDNWVSGYCGEYIFESKLFDESSVFGIDSGRVSKLNIRKDGNRFFDCIVNYDRGWDIEPKTKEEIEVFEEVMYLLENSSKTRF